MGSLELKLEPWADEDELQPESNSEDHKSEMPPESKPNSSILSSLKSKLGYKPTEKPKLRVTRISQDPYFRILRDYLQPDSATSIKSAVQSLTALLPEVGSSKGEVYHFGEVCFELAQQIPYHHPSHLKFARLLEELGWSTKIGHAIRSTVAGIYSI
jgi:hypothetical protein